MSESVQKIKTKLLLVSKLNTRQPTPEKVAELITSVKATGQITPVIARPHPTKKDHFEIAAGARRRTACHALGIECDTIIRDIPDDEFLDMILTDNLQREDPDPHQEALLIKRRLDEGASAAEISARYGKSENWVHRRMKLFGINAKLLEKLSDELAHFNTLMREFCGSLPEEVQNELADCSHNADDIKTLAELREFVKERDCHLDGITWLDDPASFVPGCGPGCANSSAEGLFKEDNECATCLNSTCFRKRRQLFTETAITTALAGNKIKSVVVFVTEWIRTSHLIYQGEPLKVVDNYDFKDTYKISKKATDIVGLNITDIANPKLVHLTKKPKVSSSHGSKNAAATQGDPRVQRVLGKRTAHLVESLQTAIQNTDWDHVCALHTIHPHEHMIRLIAAFGGQPAQSYLGCSADCWAAVSTEIFEDCTDDLWQNIKKVFASRLGYQKLDDTLTDRFSREIANIATLIGFDLDAANAAAAASISPKWIKTEGYDNSTLIKNP